MTLQFSEAFVLHTEMLGKKAFCGDWCSKRQAGFSCGCFWTITSITWLSVFAGIRLNDP